MPLFVAAYVTSCVIIGFLLQPVTGLSPAWVALIGATILTVVVETKDVHAVMKVIKQGIRMWWLARSS